MRGSCTHSHSHSAARWKTSSAPSISSREQLAVGDAALDDADAIVGRRVGEVLRACPRTKLSRTTISRDGLLEQLVDDVRADEAGAADHEDT